MERHRIGLLLGEGLVRTVRLMRPLIPKRVQQALDDRFFGAVFQVTRVTNDNYGNGTQERPAQTDDKG